MTPREAALCGMFALALPLGQILFKYASIHDQRLAGHFLQRAVQNLPLASAFGWYGLTALLWFYVLTRVPLSVAYAFSLAGSALVPLAAWALFKEPVSWRFAVGYCLILAGLAVLAPAAAKAA